MKSRWTTCLLLAAVAAVWGVVVWKILAPRDEEVPASVSAHAQAPAREPSAGDTLRLDYPDPFLKGMTQREAGVRRTVRPLPISRRAAVKRRSRMESVHLGTVAASGRELHILRIDGTQYELAQGERAGKFRLAVCDADSIYLECEGILYGVKRCEGYEP